MGWHLDAAGPSGPRRAVLAAGAVGAAAVLLPGHARAQAPQDIQIVSDTWHDLTRKDGSGLYFDLARAVYSRARVQVRIRILPYARTVGTVRDKRADAWMASFLKEQDFPLYPKWHLDQSAQMVVQAAASRLAYTGRDALAGRRVAWMRGYGLNRYIPVAMQMTEVDSIAAGLGMLEHDRVDFFVIARSDLADHVRDAKVDMAGYRTQFLMHLGLYLAFADTARGAALRDIWDREMEILHKDAAFLAIYRRYGYEVPFGR